MKIQKLLDGLKASGVRINDVQAARLYLQSQSDLAAGVMALVRQGRSIGVQFSSTPQVFNGPGVTATLEGAGLSKEQIQEFFANIQIVYSY